MNVLVVDDEKIEIRTIRKILETIPIQFDNVYEACSMVEAMDVIKKYVVSIIICDVEMPSGSGLELTRWVKDYDGEIQVIYLTGHADFSYVRTALQFGAIDYLLKPVEKDNLEGAIMKAVRRLPDEEQLTYNMDAETIVKEVKQYIQKNFASLINRNEVAGKYFIHPDYLSHIFKSRTGMSMSDYIIQVRVAKAKKMLSGTKMPVFQVAASCGYSNTAFFAKHFRRITGMSPKEYREKIKSYNGAEK